jgi:lipopolysaccharide export system permease protein
MKVFERYLIREVVFATAVVLVAFVALFSFFEFVGELQSAGRDGYTLWEALLVSLLRTPARAYETVPIAVLIGTLYALSLLARNSELNVLRVSGVSSIGLLRALFMAASAFALLTFLVGEFVAPASDQLAQQIRPKGSRSAVSLELRSGFWLKDRETFVNIKSVRPNARLVGLNLYEFGGDGRLRSISRIEEAEYVPPDAWRLKDIVTTEYSPELGSRIVRLPEKLWRSDLNPDMLGVLNILPEAMGITTLAGYIRHLSANRQSTTRYEAALWKKVIYPLAAFVMVTLALPFAFMHGRNVSMGIRLFIGVMVGLGFYMINGLASTIGMLNQWPPMLSAVAPSALFLAIAGGLFWMTGRR